MFKINISTKQGKTFKLEAEAEALKGKKLGDKIQGKDVSPDLEGYEFEITGASDKSGFTAIKNEEGTGLKRVLLTYGKAMKKRPRREGKKKQLCKKPKGLRLRRTVRGNTISEATSQINLNLLKEGAKKLSEIFPEQVKAPKAEAPKKEAKSVEQPTDNPQQKTSDESLITEEKSEPSGEAKVEEVREETKAEKEKE